MWKITIKIAGLF